MIIGVISDSHDNLPALRDVLLRLLEYNIEKVVHLGDIISPFTVKFMKEVLGDKQVIAIRGNNDGDVHQLTVLFTKYGWLFYAEPTVIEIGGRRLLLVHGYGSVENTKNIIYAMGKSLDVDAVFYGHTHQIDIGKMNGKLLLNPGEVCGYLTGRRSFAVVDLSRLRAEVYIL